MQAVLIGVGMVARTHVDAVAATDGKVTLRGVMAAHADRAEAFAETVASASGQKPKIYNDIAEVAADPAVDLVLLCTPPNARMEIVRALAEAGKPMLMEKPIERDSAAAEEIVTLCEANGVPLGVVFQHRMREASQHAAAVLAEGALGPLAAVEVTVPWWRPQSYYDEPGRGTYARDGGGVLISQAIHTLDLMLSLTGPVRSVQAMARTTALHRMEAEDFVTAGLEFANGAVGSFVASTASYPGGPESIVLHGQSGSLRLESGTCTLDFHDGRHETLGAQATGTGGGADPMAFTHEWHQGVIEDFADAVAEGRAPLVSGREALRVHRLIDALVESSRERRAVILKDAE
ncbi:Gfo/Idh/MocA family protein [Tropicimonas isoalkanivorans]|uniref:Predicted dehydrogenase n=1 Tax=Tropicimonas isoalkanivorans TaxID=441112 RepID=A0A1I1DQB4_9RHOB|nr:Gfo/Idh/MocA family oxidoreductase [Tropicimonas isoalkanivorans]SFB76616.1 Predicted dehydrogenase [Tropicimonas isoalkanivorans]